MKPLIKWPGGKSGEISKIEHLIPKYERYIEPFFGGGAVFFHLQPESAAVNDISTSLMDFYSLLKVQNQELYRLLCCYNDSFTNLISVCNNHYSEILSLYNMSCSCVDKTSIKEKVSLFVASIEPEISKGFSGI